MKEFLKVFIALSLILSSLPFQLQAQTVTQDEALRVAQNWITLTIHKKGNWGGSPTPQMEEIQEFKRGNRILGYFCQVKPRGFIIISLHKAFAPIKAYSETSDLDPLSEKGMTDLLKGKMNQILNRFERRFGPIDRVRARDLPFIDHQTTWEELLTHDPDTFKSGLESGDLFLTYQSGTVLLSSTWAQGNPYNQQVPAPPSGDDCTQAHCDVGCVATAAAQIMRYWHWPPYGVGSPYNTPYDWPNMPGSLKTPTPSQTQINAVAELSHEIGLAVGMNYCGWDGCQSSANTSDMEGVYENKFRYTTAINRQDRSEYSEGGEDWFNLLKIQFNLNRPVQYRVLGHSMVADGWQEIGSGPTRQYHINYGWEDNHNAWYTLDALYYPTGGDKDDEYILQNIYPAQALGNPIYGTYARNSFNYRYFDMDSSSHSTWPTETIFEAGQILQFLPSVKVTCMNTLGHPIRFLGATGNETRFFTRGDLSQGVRIRSGEIKLRMNGSMKLHSGIVSYPNISIGGVFWGEGGNPDAPLSVSLSGPYHRTVTVNYATADGTAKTGQDYIATSGTLTFPPGVTSKTIFVKIINDSDIEGTETFSVNLTNATNAFILDGHGEGTIYDND
jgi:hypothetical protein